MLSSKSRPFFQNSNIKTIDCPGNSPDLTPIENCWAFIKSKLVLEDTGAIPKLTEAIKRFWTTDSMPRRIQPMISAERGITKF
jgi:hypothetical protein